MSLKHLLPLILAPLCLFARPQPPNLQLGHGIDLRDGPLLRVSSIDVDSIKFGASGYLTAWPTNGFLKAADIATALMPYSTTIADATSDLTSMTEAAGYTPASAFLYSTANSEVTITGYVGTAVNVQIPPYIGGFPVVAIGAGSVLTGLPTIKTLVLPSTLRNIGAGALTRQILGSLPRTFVIPASVTNIGTAAFSDVSLYFEGPKPAGCANLTYLNGGTAYYLAGYPYPPTLGGTATRTHGSSVFYTNGTNLYFITAAGVTNTVTITPVE